MKLSRERLLADAASSGYRPDILEKVVHLLTILEGFKAHPFLKSKLVLKGGTALNLFVYDCPRLSVDIDLNYLGSPDREIMLSERPKLEEAIKAVCSREGLSIRGYPQEHAGGKWYLNYGSALGGRGNLELDLNFLLRVPLWPIVERNSFPVKSFPVGKFLVLDENELAAGKLTALLARHAARDLFDAHHILTRGDLNHENLRLAFVTYGAMNRRDWRKVSIDDVSFDAAELEDSLVPLFSSDFLDRIGDIATWATRMVQECKERLGVVLPLAGNEKEFLDRLLDLGDTEPSLLTRDNDLRERIRLQPGLQWKALNVRQSRPAERKSFVGASTSDLDQG